MFFTTTRTTRLTRYVQDKRRSPNKSRVEKRNSTGAQSLEPLIDSAGDCSQFGIHLTWRRSKNQSTDGISSDPNVVERSKDVDVSGEIWLKVDHERSILYFAFQSEEEEEEENTTYLSANTIRVLVVFSIANLVLPSFPAMRPIARLRCSPERLLTSSIIKDSMYRSSSRSSARAS